VIFSLLEAYMRIAIYGRVSTEKQDAENQLAQLYEFATAQGWEIVLEFIDVITGGTADRPQFQAMFEAAERHEFDLLLFWSLDRLSREGVLPTLTHLERLTQLGVAYRSFTEQYLDSAGLFKDVIIAIMAVLAKQEKIRIGERTRAGLAIARSRGARLGRPAVGREAVARLSSLSAEEAALRLGVSPRTIRRHREFLRRAS
jgi:DNA invertase Pin-like site-specific DNA recombinase